MNAAPFANDRAKNAMTSTASQYLSIIPLDNWRYRLAAPNVFSNNNVSQFRQRAYSSRKRAVQWARRLTDPELVHVWSSKSMNCTRVYAYGY